MSNLFIPHSVFLFSSLLDSLSNHSSPPFYPIAPRGSHPPCWTSSSAPAGAAGQSSSATSTPPSTLHVQPYSFPYCSLLVYDQWFPASCSPMMLVRCLQTWSIWMSLLNINRMFINNFDRWSKIWRCLLMQLIRWPFNLSAQTGNNLCNVFLKFMQPKSYTINSWFKWFKVICLI